MAVDPMGKREEVVDGAGPDTLGGGGSVTVSGAERAVIPSASVMAARPASSIGFFSVQRDP
jgi:hypothetical protein